MNLNEVINNLKPREKLKIYGADKLTNEELLAIILHTGTKDISVFELAKQIDNLINNLNNYHNLSLNMLKDLKGVGEVKAITL